MHEQRICIEYNLNKQQKKSGGKNTSLLFLKQTVIQELLCHVKLFFVNDFEEIATIKVRKILLQKH